MAKDHTTNLKYATIPILVAFLSSAGSAFQPSRTGILKGVLSRSMASLSEFLACEPTFSHVVVGNPAGDADSIVSALSLAYVDHLTGSNPGVSPIVSVPRADLPLRRETVLLLEMVNVSTTKLICLDDLPSEMTDSSITLVDHNKLLYPQLSSSNVVEILDHHIDEQEHLHVKGKFRNIAFQESSAQVASTCTLIAERYLQKLATKFPADLAFILLGVILLDTVNMSESAGKGTPRDQSVINMLVDTTDWSSISQFGNAKNLFTSCAPDTTAFYNFLTQSKFDVDFWKSLSGMDALRLDYKQFTSASGDAFGVASVLLPLAAFLEKPSVEDDLKSYMLDCKIPILVILSMVIEDDKPRRSILVCGPVGNGIVGSMSDFLLSYESLLLNEIDGASTAALTIRQFTQGNVRASRKQVVPIMLEFYNDSKGTISGS
jgi:exopolyphosphatase